MSTQSISGFPVALAHPIVGLQVTLAMVGWEVESVAANAVTLLHLQHAIWPERYPRVSMSLPLAAFEQFASKRVSDGQTRGDCPRCSLRHWLSDVQRCMACAFDPASESLIAMATVAGPIGDVLGPHWLSLMAEAA